MNKLNHVALSWTAMVGGVEKKEQKFWPFKKWIQLRKLLIHL